MITTSAYITKSKKKEKENRKKVEKKARGVSHCDLAIYIKKYLKKVKEQSLNLKYFTMQKYYLQKKKTSKRNQNPSRYYYYNSIITNLKFQHKPKYHLSKFLI
jgi:hypothetical protein